MPRQNTTIVPAQTTRSKAAFDFKWWEMPLLAGLVIAGWFSGKKAIANTAREYQEKYILSANPALVRKGTFDALGEGMGAYIGAQSYFLLRCYVILFINYCRSRVTGESPGYTPLDIEQGTPGVEDQSAETHSIAVTSYPEQSVIHIVAASLKTCCSIGEAIGLLLLPVMYQLNRLITDPDAGADSEKTYQQIVGMFTAILCYLLGPKLYKDYMHAQPGYWDAQGNLVKGIPVVKWWEIIPFAVLVVSLSIAARNIAIEKFGNEFVDNYITSPRSDLVKEGLFGFWGAGAGAYGGAAIYVLIRIYVTMAMNYRILHAQFDDADADEKRMSINLPSANVDGEVNWRCMSTATAAKLNSVWRGIDKTIMPVLKAAANTLEALGLLLFLSREQLQAMLADPFADPQEVYHQVQSLFIGICCYLAALKLPKDVVSIQPSVWTRACRQLTH